MKRTAERQEKAGRRYSAAMALFLAVLLIFLTGAASGEAWEEYGTEDDSPAYGIYGFEPVSAPEDWNPVMRTAPDAGAPVLPSDAAEAGRTAFYASGWEGDWLRVLRCGEKAAVGYVHRSETEGITVPSTEQEPERKTISLPEEYTLHTDLFTGQDESVILEEGHSVTFLCRDLYWDNTLPFDQWPACAADYVETEIGGQTVRGWIKAELTWWECRWPIGMYHEESRKIYADHHFLQSGEYVTAFPEERISSYKRYSQTGSDVFVTFPEAGVITDMSFQAFRWEFSPDSTLVTLTDMRTGEKRCLEVVEFYEEIEY